MLFNLRFVILDFSIYTTCFALFVSQVFLYFIGDVRQKGLIVGVDIISSRGSKKPAPEIAEEICNRQV